MNGGGPFGIVRLYQAMKASRDDRMPQYVARMIDRMGKNIHTVSAKMLNDLTVTRDPTNVEAIFGAQAQDFDIGPNRLESFKPLLGVGVTTVRGEAWRHSRALLRPQFSREQISDLDLEERHVQAMFRVLDRHLQPDGWTKAIDFQPILSDLTHEVAIEMLYGSAAGLYNSSASLKDQPADLETAQDDSFSHHLDSGKSWLYERMMLGGLGWLFGSRSFARHCREVHQYVDRIITAKLNSLQTGKGTSSPTEKFVFLDELANHTQDPLELRNETLHVLSASWDTTAALIGWMFYFLARNHAVFQKLHEVILVDFKDGIDFVRLRDCQYLHHCINETFRCAAVIPVIERMSTRDTTLPRGGGPDGQQPIFLPKDSRVLIATYAMQQRADLWGSDVDAFRPERWEGRKIGYDFVPFAGGPRKCIGRESLSSFKTSTLRLADKLGHNRAICLNRGRVHRSPDIAAV